MKKIIFIICISLVIAANAQYDTLPYNIGIPNYFMNHPLDSMHNTQHDGVYCNPVVSPPVSSISSGDPGQHNNNLVIIMPYSIDGDLAWGFYPDSTLHVKGVAWYASTGYINGNGLSAINSWDTIDIKLFQNNGNHMSAIMWKKITRDTFTYDKVIDCKRGWPINDHVIIYEDLTRPLYEVYFDTEIDISDSMYLSVKYTWIDSIYGRNKDYTQAWEEKHSPNNINNYIFPMQSYRLKNEAGEDASWTYGETPAYLLLFPIIRRDCDSCPEVHELRYTKVGNSAAIVQWDAGANHCDWQLCYGTPGFDPDGAEATTIRVPQRALNGLSATAHYDVYVKARCKFDRSEYSPWAGPFDLCLAEIGIDGADAVEAEIGPNPTSGMLTVRCEAEIKAVELYDMQGRCVANGEVGTASGEPRMATLQVQHLPSGTYTAVVRTAQGTATKQVVVL